MERGFLAVPRMLADAAEDRVGAEMSTQETENACYACGDTETELNANGMQLYVCDECGAWCCSAHSENGPGLTLYCVECAEELS